MFHQPLDSVMIKREFIYYSGFAVCFTLRAAVSQNIRANFGCCLVIKYSRVGKTVEVMLLCHEVVLNLLRCVTRVASATTHLSTTCCCGLLLTLFSQVRRHLCRLSSHRILHRAVKRHLDCVWVCVSVCECVCVCVCECVWVCVSVFWREWDTVSVIVASTDLCSDSTDLFLQKKPETKITQVILTH